MCVAPCKRIWNPESGIRNPESGIQELFAVGIRNPEDWNPESTMVWNPESTMVWNPESTMVWIPESRKVEYIRNPEAGIRNPGPSWILLHGASAYPWNAIQTRRSYALANQKVGSIIGYFTAVILDSSVLK